MDKLRLKNYRCLEDTGEVEIKPLTLLVGANSSGKSSFLKFFPLLKQSVGEKVNGLFLWDGQYVDFNNFENTVRNNSGEIEVKYFIEKVEGFQGFKNFELKNVSVRLVIEQFSETQDFLKIIEISYEGVNAVYKFEKETNLCEITVNNVCSKDIKDVIKVYSQKELFPNLSFEMNDFLSTNISISNNAYKKICKLLRVDCNQLNVGLSMLGFLTPSGIQQMMQRNFADREVSKNMINLILYNNAIALYRTINSYFSTLSNQIVYIGPLRSNMERYYRLQNKDTTEIDSNGDNLALYLKSLPPKKFSEYNEWLSTNFNFSVDIRPSIGHIELLISEQIKVNLVDAGFGYTQILPILTTIWDVIHNKKIDDYAYRLLAIEQPELHLHPAFQKLFARVLTKIVQFYGNKIRFVIETHSEYMIDEIGQCVVENIIKSKEVNVVLFEKKNNKSGTVVKPIAYDVDGILQDWPYGFFD